MPSSTTTTLQVTNLPQSTSFFLSILQPLDYIFQSHSKHDNAIAFAPSQTSPPDFWLRQRQPRSVSSETTASTYASADSNATTTTTHIAFPARSPERVSDFFRVALKAGGTGIAEPASRSGGLYTAVVADLDGNTIEAVFCGNARSVFSTVSNSRSTRTASEVKAKSIAGSVVSAGSRNDGAPVKSSLQNEARIEGIGRALTEARDALNVATGLMGHARLPPPRISSMSSSNPSGQASVPNSVMMVPDPNSHKPSDTIVGTILGVAAGAALGYVFTKVASPSGPTAETVARQPQFADSAHDPTVVLRQSNVDRQLCCHGLVHSTQSARSYAIEASESGTDYTRASGRKILMLENTVDDTGSGSIVSLPASSSTSRSRTEKDVAVAVTGGLTSAMSKASKKSSKTRSEAQLMPSGPPSGPPSSYRNPTVATQLDGSHVSSHHTIAGSHLSSQQRKTTDTQTRAQKGSMIAGSRSGNSEASRITVKPIKDSSTETGSTISRSRVATLDDRSAEQRGSSRTASSTSTKSKSPKRDDAEVDPLAYPLPASRAGTTIERADRRGGSEAGTAFHSTHSKACKTVIGRVQERTESVLGKLQGLREVKVAASDIGPSDSVSQVSSKR